MMVACRTCGMSLAETEKFCGNCGASIAIGVAVPRDADGAVAPSGDSARSPLPTQSPASSIPQPVVENRPPMIEYGYQSAAVQNMTNNQTVNVNTNIAMIQRHSGPNLLVRALWFVFIGWWLGGLAVVLAYLLFLPIITIPFGIGIINRLPQVMTLRPRTMSFRMTQSGDTLIIAESSLPQRPWWQRIIYLVLVGWWLGAFWLAIAWVFGALAFVTFGLTLPIAFWMFNRAGAVTSLYRT